MVVVVAVAVFRIDSGRPMVEKEERYLVTLEINDDTSFDKQVEMITAETKRHLSLIEDERKDGKELMARSISTFFVMLRLIGF